MKGAGDMRHFSILAVSVLLAACGIGNAASRSADQADPVSVQVNSGAEAEAEAEAAQGIGAMNAAITNASMAEADLYPDGHVPANWYHMIGDILVLEGGGFSFAQPGLHPARYIDFGLPRATVIDAVTIIRGRPSGSGRIARCAGGPLDFTAYGALVLNFRHDRFVGWVLNPGARPSIETDLGLGIGTPRDQVAYGDEDPTYIGNSPRGPQFEVAEIGGFLSSNRPNARVTRLYSGATCFARTPPDLRSA